MIVSIASCSTSSYQGLDNSIPKLRSTTCWASPRRSRIRVRVAENPVTGEAEAVIAVNAAVKVAKAAKVAKADAIPAVANPRALPAVVTHRVPVLALGAAAAPATDVVVTVAHQRGQRTAKLNH